VRFALHRIGDTRYSHDLEAYARDTNPEVRGKTALALGLLEEPSAVVVLRPMRKDVQSSVRLQASASLWLMHDPQGLDDLAAYAISKFPDDLIIATLALAGPKDQRVLQHVEANLTADYPEVCLAAARACGELGSDEGYSIAIKGAHSQDPRQRLLAALALGAIGRSDAQPVLAQLLKDPVATVQVGAATAILQLGQRP
jgi:HEAT repeat protein